MSNTITVMTLMHNKHASTNFMGVDMAVLLSRGFHWMEASMAISLGHGYRCRP